MQQQIELHTLRGSIVYLDEALTMSARLFVLTKDDRWKNNYQERVRALNSTIMRVYSLLPANFNGKSELATSIAELMNRQRRAFALMDSDHAENAKTILFSREYQAQKDLYKKGLEKLKHNLDQAEEELIALHDTDAKQTSLFIIATVLFVLWGWCWYLYVFRQWQKRIDETNRKRTKEVIEAAQKLAAANEQLHLLSAHLEETREKERLQIAKEINEELEQQIAALKMKVGIIQKDILSGEPIGNKELQQVSVQLGDALDSLTRLADDVYPLALRDLGLVEALQWKTQKMSKGSLSVSFFSEEENLVLDQRTAVNVFRSFQEKIEKMAASGAKEIVSSLRVEKDELVISIFNDGSAMDLKIESMEDLAINERIRGVNGRIETLASAREGNCFSIYVPYRQIV